MPGALPPVWNVPHLRNRNFTGRETLLKELWTTLLSGQHATTTQAITGLGGMGKTQLAIEFAYRHNEEYNIVWWMRAEEPATLAAEFAQLAVELALPAKDFTSQQQIIFDVRRWLGQKGDWLLIFDNANNPEEICPYLPQGTTGHVLITSRNPNWLEVASTISLREWEREESVEFLCRRIKQTDRRIADELAEELGDLPLALEHAAAYIETTGRTMSEYLDLFRNYNLELMKGSQPPVGYKDTITTTWKLAFEQVQTTSPLGADLLRLFAFFAPDHIPKEILTYGSEWLPERLVTPTPIEFDRAVAVLRRYSLLNLDIKGLSIHRFVQAVQRNEMSEEEKQFWVRTAICFSNELSKYDDSDSRTWIKSIRLLPHVLVASKHAEHFIQSEDYDIALTFYHLGSILKDLDNLIESEHLLKRAVAIWEKVLSPEHPNLAASYNQLAILYQAQGKYDKAEPLFQRASAIFEKIYGLEDIKTVSIINNLSWLYKEMGHYDKAEALLVGAIDVLEKALTQQDFSKVLTNLATIYSEQGKYGQAKPLYERALALKEKTIGPEEISVADSLLILAKLYLKQGEYDKAKHLLYRALAISEKILPEVGPENLGVIPVLNDLALLHQSQAQYDQAEPFYQRSLAILEKVLGSKHPETSIAIERLALLYKDMRRYTDAEDLLIRDIEIWEELDPEDLKEAESLNRLANIYFEQEKYEEAKPLYQRTLAIVEKKLGYEHQNTATSFANLGILYEIMGWHAEAEFLLKKALTIWEKVIDLENYNIVGTLLDNIPLLYEGKGMTLDLAKSLLRCHLTLSEKVLGHKHTKTVSLLDSLVLLCQSMGHYEEAKQYSQRALDICEKLNKGND
ncbi:FxSxx-COOH system tetratricopeptide repeat protein [Desulfotomaculum defluvii]